MPEFGEIVFGGSLFGMTPPPPPVGPSWSPLGVDFRLLDARLTSEAVLETDPLKERYMAALHQIIPAKVVGDTLRFERTYKVPAGIIAAKVYLTFKKKEADTDLNSVFPMIEIDQTATEHGQITAPDSTQTGEISLRLMVTPEESSLCVPNVGYHHCMKMITTEGDPYTLEKGRIMLSESGVDTSV